MSGNTLFSIVIPVYRIEKYIQFCVESILNQTYTDFEIVLVDDGSPDNCPQICDDLQKNDKRIKVHHKKNGGVSAARNDGAQIANGEYLIFVDGDDWLDSRCLEFIADAIRKTKADIVCHGLVYDNGTELLPRTLEYRDGYYSHDDVEKELYPILIQAADAKYFIPSLCGKAIKKQLFMENFLSDKRVILGEDGACIIPCVFHASSMYILKECLYYYRFNESSATRSKRVYNWEWPRLVAEHLEKKVDIDRGDFREQLDRKIAHDVFTVVLSQFNCHESYKDIIRDIQMHLDEEPYCGAIRRCKFKNSKKAFLMQFTLKKRVFFPIYFYACLRTRL